jgi:hypothetical protein
MRASVTLFRYAAHRRLYPCSITGAPGLGYLVSDGELPIPTHVRPFNSEVHSASALLPDSHHHGLKTMPVWLSGNRFEAYSSSSAFLYLIGRDFMPEQRECQEGIIILEISDTIPRHVTSRRTHPNDPAPCGQFLHARRQSSQYRRDIPKACLAAGATRFW